MPPPVYGTERRWDSTPGNRYYNHPPPSYAQVTGWVNTEVDPISVDVDFSSAAVYSPIIWPTATPEEIAVRPYAHLRAIPAGYEDFEEDVDDSYLEHWF